VNYYSTTYVQGKLFGDYCNLATNLVLSWPNDGVSKIGRGEGREKDMREKRVDDLTAEKVTELEYAQLPGGQNQGNTEV
jgi:hypothetical protein